MSDGTSVKIPTWALPIAAAAISGAIAWGSMQAQAQATSSEVARIEQVVKETAVVDSLSQQQETLKSTDEKLAQLIQIMLQKQ